MIVCVLLVSNFLGCCFAAWRDNTLWSLTLGCQGNREVGYAHRDERTNPRWTLVKIQEHHILAMMDKYIPSKVRKKCDRLPYMTKEIHRLTNRKNRAHKQWKKAQRNFATPSVRIKNLDKKTRDLKHNIQKKMRQAYWLYMKSIITRSLMTPLTQAHSMPWRAFGSTLRVQGRITLE